MGKRLHTTVQSYEKVDYSIEIHDTDFTGTSILFTAENLSLNFNAVGQSRLNEIITTTLNVGILIKNAAQESFITDLIGANESRFNIIFKKGSVIKFVGYLITDSIQIENMSYPFSFQISAVDGLARLKDLDYNNAGTAYSGKATITEHLTNIVNQIGLSSLAGTTITKQLEWLEDSHASGSDLLDNTRFDHGLFTKQDSNGNDQFINSFAVLKEVCKIFLARFLYWDGAYHFQQINKYFTLSDYDISVPKAIRGGIWQFLPALRQSKIIFKYGKTLNLAQNLSLNEANNNVVLNTSIKNGTPLSIKGEIEYKTEFLTDFILANNGIAPHRLKFRLVIKLIDYYFERKSNEVGFYQVFNEEPKWSLAFGADIRYYEIYTPVIAESNYFEKKQIGFNIETPDFPGLDNSDLDLSVELIEVSGVNDATYTTEITNTWILKNISISESNDNANKIINSEKIFTATNTVTGNSKTITVETKMGDLDVSSSAKLEVYTGTEWQDSNAWTKGSFSAVPIGQLLANEILAGQNKHIRVLQHTLIMSDFSPLHRVTYKGVKYMFLRGTWTPEQDEIAGEWVEVALDESAVTEGGVITGDGSTNTNPTDPNSGITKSVGGSTGDVSTNNTDNNLNNLTIALLDLVKNAKANLDIVKDTPITQITVAGLPTNTNLNEGDKIQIIHPVTGLAETVTLAANPNNVIDTSRYEAGNTTLFIESYTPTQNFPIGSVLVKDTDASPTKSTSKIHKVSNHSGAFIDAPFDLPADSEVDGLLTVIREYGTAIFEVTFFIGNDGNGDRRRITPIADLPYENEAVLIKLES